MFCARYANGYEGSHSCVLRSSVVDFQRACGCIPEHTKQNTTAENCGVIECLIRTKLSEKKSTKITLSGHFKMARSFSVRWRKITSVYMLFPAQGIVTNKKEISQNQIPFSMVAMFVDAGNLALPTALYMKYCVNAPTNAKDARRCEGQ